MCTQLNPESPMSLVSKCMYVKDEYNGLHSVPLIWLLGSYYTRPQHIQVPLQSPSQTCSHLHIYININTAQGCSAKQRWQYIS